jgi:tetratricopeptide (TPR) repeat protein
VLNRLESGDDDSLSDSIELMWELALSIEDGDLSAAERELRNAQRALQEALARDASEEEIAELMDRLREAVNRYMQAMIEQAQRNGDQAQRAPDGARELRPQDFDNLLDTIENLARAGANDAAQEMLAQLQNMLENMQAGRGQGSMSQRDSEMARMLEQLGELMGDQQQLMDDTYGSQRQQGTEGPGARGGSSSEFQELSELQEGLAQTLEDILSGLQRRGVEGPSALGQAEEAMRDAIEALRQNDREGAVGEQGEALDQLREGAQAMAQQMLQGDGSQGALGRHGRGNNDENRDPLGRPLNSSGPELGLSTEVPSEIEIQRARKILRELQDRVGDRQRPQVELEYLDRLLDRF